MHAWNDTDGSLDGSNVSLELFWTLESAARWKPGKRQTHREYVARDKARIDVDQTDKAADEERRPAEQDECDRHFGDDERVEQPAPGDARCLAACAHGAGKAQASASKCRHESEHDRGDARDGKSKHQHARIEPHARFAWQEA